MKIKFKINRSIFFLLLYFFSFHLKNTYQSELIEQMSSTTITTKTNARITEIISKFLQPATFQIECHLGLLDNKATQYLKKLNMQ